MASLITFYMACAFVSASAILLAVWRASEAQ
jgi:hypothetical protein